MDELISKRTVIGFIEYHIEHPSENFDLRDLIEEIKDEPSATPKQRTGYWIEIGKYGHNYQCSECGRVLINILDGKNKVAIHYPYCHCGAKMEVEE